VCRPRAIAWCTKKSPGPIVKNSEFLPLLIASIHPGSQILLLATLAALVEDESRTSNPYKAFPDAA